MGDDRRTLLKESTDVLVYAATPAGISAALSAGKLGKHVIVLEPSAHVGGGMISGVSVTDSYPQEIQWAIGGFAQQFIKSVETHYGSVWTLGGTRHEPHVAEEIFLKMLSNEPNVKVKYDERIESVKTANHKITSIVTDSGEIYSAKMFIDASYEGDLLVRSGVGYTQGRESQREYGESLAGVTPVAVKEGANVDPYVVAGNPDSGLLPHINLLTAAEIGSADSSLQAYGYRLCVTPDKTNQIPVVRPVDYTPSEFEAVGRIAVAHPEMNKTFDFIGNIAIPNNKYDVNNVGIFSTDEIEGSSEYLSSDNPGRRAIEAERKRYTMAFLYFLATDSRIPTNVRAEVGSWGLCKDEFVDNNGMPPRLYIREGRRMIGSYVITQDDLYGKTSIPDSIGLGGFPIDEHIVKRVVINGQIGTEGILWEPLPRPYPISYRAIIPKPGEARNLLVPVSVSASHIGWSSLRVEPTFMIIGQAAGAAASIAIDADTSVQRVNYARLSEVLIAGGAVLSLQ